MIDRKTIPPHLAHNKFLSKVWTGIHRNSQDVKIAVCADSRAGSPTGVGKSSLCVRFGEVLDIDQQYRPRFSVDRVVFNLDEFRGVLKERLPRGSVIALEEAQTWFNSRTFISAGNMDIVKKFSTGRVFGYIFVLNYPSFDDIDVQVRRLIHYECRITHKDTENRLIHYTPYQCVPGWSNRDPIYRKPFEKVENGVRSLLCYRSRLPSTELWRQYEQAALVFKERLSVAAVPLSKKVDRVAEKHALVEERLNGYRDQILKDTGAFSTNFGLSAGKIASSFGLSRVKGERLRYLVLEALNKGV